MKSNDLIDDSAESVIRQFLTDYNASLEMTGGTWPDFYRYLDGRFLKSVSVSLEKCAVSMSEGFDMQLSDCRHILKGTFDASGVNYVD